MLYKTAFWGALGKGDTMKREDGESMSKVISVTEMFGKDVFNDAVMRDRLPKSVYKKLKKTIEDGAELDRSDSMVMVEFWLDKRRVISEKSLASKAILPCSRIWPSTFVSIPSSISFPVRRISLEEASIRIHSKIDMVVLDGTAFITMLMPFTMASFWNCSFMIVDNFLSE